MIRAIKVHAEIMIIKVVSSSFSGITGSVGMGSTIGSVGYGTITGSDVTGSTVGSDRMFDGD
jgi:hypothetical protein